TVMKMYTKYHRLYIKNVVKYILFIIAPWDYYFNKFISLTLPFRYYPSLMFFVQFSDLFLVNKSNSFTPKA
ncbi:MAG TPA: hypothetical protein PLC65_20190, partial [Bacteroidia bacterium]|nr:hypothetical protein [Bacteroidia bacterium]